ncbi:SHOCT domain-containing protein [Microbacterium sp. LWH3-1.2]|uniref:SHOCT domain-containing protein n=1 Tax=Microbacterium sp. LWH3-1.2 TaxID=3135256 RepID=UPI00343D952A
MNIWDFFVWMFWFYVVVTCIWIFITVIMDVFRAPDLGGWAKALWALFLVLVPFLAAFIYLIARGGKMSQRQAARAQEAQAETDSQIRAAAGTSSPGAEIESAKRLLDSGAITQAEFDTLKNRALVTA